MNIKNEITNHIGQVTVMCDYDDCDNLPVSKQGDGYICLDHAINELATKDAEIAEMKRRLVESNDSYIKACDLSTARQQELHDLDTKVAELKSELSACDAARSTYKRGAIQSFTKRGEELKELKKELDITKGKLLQATNEIADWKRRRELALHAYEKREAELFNKLTKAEKVIKKCRGINREMTDCGRCMVISDALEAIDKENK